MGVRKCVDGWGVAGQRRCACAGAGVPGEGAQPRRPRSPGRDRHRHGPGRSQPRAPLVGRGGRGRSPDPPSFSVSHFSPPPAMPGRTPPAPQSKFSGKLICGEAETGHGRRGQGIGWLVSTWPAQGGACAPPPDPPTHPTPNPPPPRCLRQHAAREVEHHPGRSPGVPARCACCQSIRPHSSCCCSLGRVVLG
jgi:hypothetical protein